MLTFPNGGSHAVVKRRVGIEAMSECGVTSSKSLELCFGSEATRGGETRAIANPVLEHLPSGSQTSCLADHRINSAIRTRGEQLA